MTKFDLVEHMSNISAHLMSRFKLAHAYGHTFSRYFRPTELNLRLSELTGGKPFPDVNVPLGDSEKGVGAVVGGLFSFEAADPQTVQKYFAEMKPQRTSAGFSHWEAAFDSTTRANG